MIDLNNLLELDPYSLSKQEKDKIYAEIFNDLSKHHYSRCSAYKKILDTLDFKISKQHFRKLPPVPVRIFKDYDLKSVNDDQIIKTMTSSGTSGQNVSKIYLDRFTATNQTKVLAKILSNFLGTKRLPMLIIDTKEILKNRNNFSARAAGILGFRTFGYDPTFALNSDMTINHKDIKEFLEKHKDENILSLGLRQLFGSIYKVLLNRPENKIKMPNATLIHGGDGKLENESVDTFTFRKRINESWDK